MKNENRINIDSQISKKELKIYFKEKGADLDKLFDPERYDRYTEENHSLLADTFEYFTDWKLTEKGLELQGYPDERAKFIYPKITSMNEFKNPDEYLRYINQFREDKAHHIEMIEKGREQLERDKLKESINEFLQETKNTNIEEMLTLSDSKPERNEMMNSVLEKFAHSKIIDENIYTIDPRGGEHQQTNSGMFLFSKIQSADHFIQLIEGSKEIRNRTFFLKSKFVRQGKRITKEAVHQKVEEMSNHLMDDILLGTGMSQEERLSRLQQIHFHFTEVRRDMDGDMVFPRPDNPMQVVSNKDMKNQPDYYKSIKTLDELIKKMESARLQRDLHYLAHEQVEEIIEKRLKELKKEQGDDQLER